MSSSQKIVIAGCVLFGSVSPSLAQEIPERHVREAINAAGESLGRTIVPGSPTTGPANTAGGLGHFHIGVAATAASVTVADPRNLNRDEEFYVATGSIYGVLGIARGWTLAPGLGGLGSVDLLVRLGVVAEVEDYQPDTGSFSLGARVGVLRDGPGVPAISATILHTSLDEIEFGDPDEDDIRFAGELDVLSIRADISKDLIALTPFAGAGVDRTSIDASYRIPPSRSIGGSDIRGSVDTSETHGRFYGGLQFSLAVLAVTLEVGSQGDEWYGTVGASVGL